MEKKTIGGLIAALRKANGMTQRDLADRIGVSDKTVSRWERDDGYPDLSVIPVLAEIFGITCDELLRGECKPQGFRKSDPSDGESSAKGEKTRQHILARQLVHYQNKTYLASGLSVLGLIVAGVFNLGFLRAFLGFLFGCMFFLASLICQAVFWNQATFCIAQESVTDPAVNQWKRTALRITKCSLGVTVACFGFTLPLLLGDTYSGLVESWPFFGTIGCVTCLLIYSVICYFWTASQIKRGVYLLQEQEQKIYTHNHKLKMNCVRSLIGCMVLLFVVQCTINNIWDARKMMEGQTFTDYDSLVAYMEQDVAYPQYSSDMVVAPAPDSQITYFDENGNEISEDEALRVNLLDRNDVAVCSFIQRNQMVIGMDYARQDGTVLPVTVYTQLDLQVAQNCVALRNACFYVGYAMVIVVTFGIYFKKRKTKADT